MKNKFLACMAAALLLSGCANPITQPDVYAPEGERHVKVTNFLFEPVKIMVNGQELPETLEKGDSLVIIQEPGDDNALNIVIKRQSDGGKIQKIFPSGHRSKKFYGSVEPIQIFYRDF